MQARARKFLTAAYWTMLAEHELVGADRRS